MSLKSIDQRIWLKTSPIFKKETTEHSINVIKFLSAVQRLKLALMSLKSIDLRLKNLLPKKQNPITSCYGVLCFQNKTKYKIS
jgi:hypothetical protein